MIVKVQISLASSNGAIRMLIYNEDKTVFYEADATPDTLQSMAGSNKKYFHANLTPDPNKKGGYIIDIVAGVPDQIW